MNEPFPHLLVATEYPPVSPGGGLVLVRQMLRGWPADRISWWSCRPSVTRGEGQAVAAHFVAPLPAKLYPNRKFARARAFLMERLWVPYGAAHLRRTLQQCQPEVVLVIPQAWSIPVLARVLPEGKVPFHVSMHDYPDLRTVVERIGSGTARRLALDAERLYARANSRDAICAPMRDDLRERTGADGTICRVGVEAEDLDALDSKPSVRPGEIRIAFAGTIIAESAFDFFVRALAGIRERLPRPVRLEFFGAHTQRERAWFDASWMRERRNLPEPEFRAALRECTWGVAPTAFGDEDPRYHRFSFPAKIAGYLAAGLPIITLAHPQSSLAELAGRYAIGLCSTTSDLETLKAELLAALAEGDPWSRYGAEIRRCVREEFNAARMRAALQAQLRTAAGSGR
jgi:glycosyltransferase involved in cell wall biosynthesis